MASTNAETKLSRHRWPHGKFLHAKTATVLL